MTTKTTVSLNAQTKRFFVHAVCTKEEYEKVAKNKWTKTNFPLRKELEDEENSL